MCRSEQIDVTQCNKEANKLEPEVWKDSTSTLINKALHMLRLVRVCVYLALSCVIQCREVMGCWRVCVCSVRPSSTLSRETLPSDLPTARTTCKAHSTGHIQSNQCSCDHLWKEHHSRCLPLPSGLHASAVGVPFCAGRLQTRCHDNLFTIT